MSKNFRDFLTIILAGVVTVGALSAMGRAAKKDDEPKGEEVPFSFEQLDDPKSGWEVKGLSEMSDFTNSVVRVLNCDLINPVVLGFGNEYAVFNISGEEFDLGLHLSENETVDATIKEEGRTRFVGESGTVTANGQTFEYESYIDFYVGDGFTLLYEEEGQQKKIAVKAELMQVVSASAYGVCLVKEG